MLLPLMLLDAFGVVSALSMSSFEAQDAVIEVQLNSVWVTGILGNPMYVACKNCRTKRALQAP